MDPQSLLASFLTPDSPASPNADEMRTIYIVMLIVVVAIVVVINAALIAAIVRFRARRDDEPARRTASRGVVPRVAAGLGVFALVVFVLGIVYTESARDVQASGPEGLQAAAARTAQVNPTSPPDSDQPTLEINAIGQQWLWRYEYPPKESDDQTFQPVFSYTELVVPVDTTVLVSVTSTDVIHRWSVPSLAGMVDAVPGTVARTWFKADEEGTYEGRSTQYSGPGYPTMRTEVKVVSATEYEDFLETQQAEISEAQDAVQGVDEQAAADEAADDDAEAEESE